MAKLVAINNNVIVDKDDDPVGTKDEQFAKGTVVSTGELCSEFISKNDRIVFCRQQASTIDIDGRQLWIMYDTAVIGVITED
jgi:co-chaperonin GroES (HSP10)